MYRSIFCSLFLLFSTLSLWAQDEEKPVVPDSFRVTIRLVPDGNEIKKATNFDQAYQDIDVQFHYLIFSYGKERAVKHYKLPYDEEQDAWTSVLPEGVYNMTVEHAGFVNQKVPMAVEDTIEEVFYLKVDSLPYTYQDGNRYDYIYGTLDFSSTIFVQFSNPDPLVAKEILDALLPTYPEVTVRNIQKVPKINAFFIDLDVKDRTPLPRLLYRQVSDEPIPPRGIEIGYQITKTIELLQNAPEVQYANPFFNGTDPKFLKTEDYPKSEDLEKKLIRQLEGS